MSRVEKKRMHPTVVERIVFSPDGMDMVTVDRRTGEQGYDDGKESILCLFVVLSSNHGVLIEVLLGFLLFAIIIVRVVNSVKHIKKILFGH